MKKRFYITIAVILFLLIAGAVLWLGGVFGVKKSAIEDASDRDVISADITENSDENAIGDDLSNKVPDESPGLSLPDGFDKLYDKNPEINKERRQDLYGSFENAIARIKDEPDSSRNWYDLGVAKSALKDYSGAESAWLFAIEVNPSASVPSQVNLAQLYWHKMPNYPKSEAMFLRAIENSHLTGSAPRLYRDLSDFYRYSYTEKAYLADDILLEGLVEYPNHPDLLSYLARYYQDTGERDLAIKYYEKYLEVNPEGESAKEELELLRSQLP